MDILWINGKVAGLKKNPSYRNNPKSTIVYALYVREVRS